MIYADDDDDDNDYNDEDDNILVVDKVTLSPLYSGRIESWGVGLCGGRKKQRNRIKTLEARKRIKNKLKPQGKSRPGVEPRSQ